MKVYLAGPYGAREAIAAYASELTRIGFTVTSSWLQEKHEINKGTQGAATALSDEQVATHARTDVREVRESDLLVLFTAGSVGVEGGGGRHVETGIAIEANKSVLVVGEPENVFHRMGGRVSTYPDWHETLIELAARRVAAERDLPRAVES